MDSASEYTNRWLEWISGFYHRLGVDSGHVELVSTLTLALLAVLVSFIVYLILSRVGHPVIRKFVIKTPAKWDDDLFNDRLLQSVSALVSVILLNQTLPVALIAWPQAKDVVGVMCIVLMIVLTAVVLTRLLKSIYLVCEEHTSLRIASLKGLFLMAEIGVWGCAAILAVAALVHRNPVIIISGLGASAAVLMLVFRDSILGVVAGVQLTFNDMLRTGDWITMPSHGINGIVIEVLLTTVKIQNYDMTVVTIPPYALISESFQNWRFMRESGGRRIMRSFNIDLNTIRHLTPDEVETFRREPWGKDLDPEATQVNMTVFRRYLEYYIAQFSCSRPEDNMFMMVRELQPTPEGLPVEIYLFTPVIDWVSYEGVQAMLTDHIIASVSKFHLRLFQSPSGLDISGR